MRTILARLTTATLAVAFVSPAALGDIFYVDSRVASSGDGLLWSTAFKTLQEALDAAEFNEGLDEIWVAEGVYRPAIGTSTTDPGFSIPGEVHIFGGFDGTELNVADRSIDDNPTILDAVIQTAVACGEPSAGDCFAVNGTPGCDDFDCCTQVSQLEPLCGTVEWDANCASLADIFCNPPDPARVRRVVEAADGWGDRRLNGFTVRRGDGGATTDGAGIGIVDGVLAVVNCTIEANDGNRGGGVAFLVEAIGSEVVNCRIVDNSGNFRRGGVAFIGPGSLVNCEIAFNGLRQTGGGMVDTYGGGIYDIAGDGETDPVVRSIVNCTVVRNEAKVGVGIATESSQASNLFIENSIV